jgi:hypothetical protein
MNLGLGPDAPSMAHLLNLLSGAVVTYAAVTRGRLSVARGLAYLTGRSG